MATVLGLAMKITADASGLSRSLTPVDRALQRLSEQTSATASLFDKFVGSTGGAAAAQRQFATDVAFLTSEMKRGLRSPQEYAAEYQKLTTAAQETAVAFAEGLRLSEQFATSQERQAATTQRLAQLYDLGAIGLETYNRASVAALGINEQAARSEQQRAQASARAAQITASVMTPMERYDAQVRELVQHKQAATISEETYRRALEQATQTFIRAESAALGYDAAVQSAGAKSGLAFNELAGTLAILPGPIGNIAGRLSGLSSAAEGLNRIFSNGGGIGQFGAALAGIVNPATLAVGGLAAVTAGAVAAGRGLVQLEDEVERLGILADKLGTSFGFVQILENAASRSGGSVEQLSASFTRFLKTLNDARSGGDSAVAAFGRLGLGIDALRASSPEEIFRNASRAITAIQDPAARTAAAIALFGKSGSDLVPVLQKVGVAGDDIERLGGALGDGQRRRVDEFGDALDRLTTAAQGFGRRAFASFAGAGTAIADASAEAIGAINRFIQEQDKLIEQSQRIQAERGIVPFMERIGLASNPARKELEAARKAAQDLAAVEPPQFIRNEEFEAASRLLKTLDDIKAASEDFGTNQELAGAAAARAVELFSKQAEAAGMSSDEIKAFADAANADFQRFIDGVRRAADESTNAAEEREKAIERLIRADEQRANAFIQRNGLEQEVDAAADLLAITRQIEEAEAAIANARAANDREAEAAAVRRLRILDQAQAAAQDNIELGFNAEDINRAIRGAQGELDAVIAKAAEFGQAGVEAAIKFQDAIAGARQKLQAEDGGLLDPKGFDQIVAKERQRFQDRIAQIEEVRNLELQLVEEKAQLEERRLRDIFAARSQPLQLADVRTTEGQRQFLAAAGATEDPAIAEYRLTRQAIERLERKVEAAKKVEMK